MTASFKRPDIQWSFCVQDRSALPFRDRLWRVLNMRTGNALSEIPSPHIGSTGLICGGECRELEKGARPEVRPR